MTEIPWFAVNGLKTAKGNQADNKQHMNSHTLKIKLSENRNLAGNSLIHDTWNQRTSLRWKGQRHKSAKAI